jgi:hypothetical protein
MRDYNIIPARRCVRRVYGSCSENFVTCCSAGATWQLLQLACEAGGPECRERTSSSAQLYQVGSDAQLLAAWQTR